MRMSPFFTSTWEVMCSGLMMSQSPTCVETSTTTPSWISFVSGSDAMSSPPSAPCIGPSRCVPLCSEVSIRCDTIWLVCRFCV